MTLTTVVLDSGNGHTNAAILDERDRRLTHQMATVRSSITSGNLSWGKAADYTVFSWRGQDYVAGWDITQLPPERIRQERQIGPSRYGNESQLFFLAATLSELGMTTPKGQVMPVNLVTLTPPGYFEEAKTRILEAYGNREVYEITASRPDKNGQLRTSTTRFQIAELSVQPEGLAAVSSILLDEKGVPVETSLLNGRVLILDVGYFTADAPVLNSGRLDRASLGNVTFPDFGIRSGVVTPLLSQLRTYNPDFSVLTENHIDQAIRLGLNGRGFNIASGGQAFDFESLFNHIRDEYANRIMSTVIDSEFSGLRGYEYIIPIGGGAYFLMDHLKARYGSKVVDVTTLPHTKKVGLENLNAEGPMRKYLHRRNS